MLDQPSANNAEKPADFCPYVGLIPFDITHEKYFFGRDDQIINAASNLKATCLTVFYGASGVGKSSLLNAGVVPYLQRIESSSTVNNSPKFIFVMLREWANNPIGSLKKELENSVVRAFDEKLFSAEWSREKIKRKAAELNTNTDLSKVLSEWTEFTKSNFLIIFDQFEDLFLHPDFLSGENSFGEQLPKVLNNSGLPVNFMISLRDDALGKLDFFKSGVPNLMKNTLRLLPLDRAATEIAIRQPLEKYNSENGTNFRITDSLVEKLLDDLQAGMVKFDSEGQAKEETKNIAQPNAANENAAVYQVDTPYLQLVMTRLWNDAKKSAATESFNETWIFLETLNDAGGVEEIVKTHLNDVMNQLTEGNKTLAAKFIHFTVTSNGAKIPTDINQLIDWASLKPAEKPAVMEILDKLCDSRIFKTVPNRRNPANPFYEITHDALAPALLNWRKEQIIIEEKKAAELAEEQKRQLEIKEKEAAHQIELEKERKQKEQQDGELKAERENRRRQEKLLIAERRSRMFGRLIWILLGLLMFSAIGIYYFISSKSQKDVQKYHIGEVAIQTASENLYKDEAEQYKSLTDILIKLQSKDSREIDEGLDLLSRKADNNELPEEYRRQFSSILSKNKLDSPDTIKQRQTVEKIKNSAPKVEKTLPPNPAIVFIQYQNESQKTNATTLQTALSQSGIIAPGVENVGAKSPDEIELRYFHGQSEERTVKCVITYLNNLGINAVPKPMSGYEDLKLIRQNQFELWFTSDPIPQINTTNQKFDCDNSDAAAN